MMQNKTVEVENLGVWQVSTQEFENCVRANVFPKSNEMRSNAEKFLSKIAKEKPNEYISGLARLLSENKDLQIRSFCAVMIRRWLIVLDSGFEVIPTETQTKLKNLLLQLTRKEANRSVLLQISEALSSLACKMLLNKEKWDELVPWLMQLSKSEDASHRESFLIVLDGLAEYACDILRPDMKNIKDMLITSMQDKNDRVRIAGLKATVSLLISIDEFNELPQFADIVPLLFKNIQMTNQNTSENSQVISKTCEQLIILAGTRSDFFSKAMKPIVQCLSDVIKCNQFEWETRQLAMDLLLTLITRNIDCFENDSDLRSLGEKIVPLCFLFVYNFDSSMVDDWHDPSDINDQTTFIFGGTCLSKICELIGCSIFWDLCHKNILMPGFQAKSDWKQRLAALTTIETCIELCSELFLQNNDNNDSNDSNDCNFNEEINRSKLDPIVQATGESLSNENIFIRYEALNAVRHLSVAFGNYGFENAYHQCIINALNNIISPNSNQHRCVLIRGCDTLAQFAYLLEPTDLAKYAPNALKGLYDLLQRNDKLVQCEVLKSISVFSSGLVDYCDESNQNETGFVRYYDTFMQTCMKIIESNINNEMFNNSEASNVRGRAMECIGHIMISVCDRSDKIPNNLNKYMTDGHNIIKTLLPYFEKEHESGFDSYNNMVKLFAYMGTAMQSEFKSYLKYVIPPLIKSTQLEPTDCHLESNNNNTNNNNIDNKENLNNNNNVFSTDKIMRFTGHVHNKGDVEIVINSTEMQEKKNAVVQLARYCETMGSNLFEFVKPICMALLPITKYKFDCVMRRNACHIMPDLVSCAFDGLTTQNDSNNNDSKESDKQIDSMLNQIIPNIVDSWRIEQDLESIIDICDDLVKLLEFINIKNGMTLSKDVISDIIEEIGATIQERMYRKNGSNQESEVSSVINGSNGSNEQTEADLAEKICDVVAKMTQLFCDNFVTLYHETSYKATMELFDKDSTNDADWVFGLSLFTELINNGGKQASQYIPEMLSKCVEYLNNSNNNGSFGLKQSIAFAVGIMATKKQFHNNLNPKFWTNALKNGIIDVIDEKGFENDDNNSILARDNGVSAIAKIMENYWNDMVLVNNNINFDFIGGWIQLLPIKEDSDERSFCNEFLIKLLSLKFNNSMNKMLVDLMIEKFGNKMISKLIEIISFAIVNEDEQSKQFKSMFEHLNKCCDKTMINQAIGQLPSEYKQAFEM